MCVYVLFLSSIVWVGCWRRLIQQCAEVACSSGALCAECSPNDKWGSRSPSPPPPSPPNEWMTEISAAASGALFTSQKISTFFSHFHTSPLSLLPLAQSVCHIKLSSKRSFSLNIWHFLYLFFNGWLEAIEHVIWMNKQKKLFAWAGGEGGEGAWQEISGKFQLSLEGK